MLTRVETVWNWLRHDWKSIWNCLRFYWKCFEMFETSLELGVKDCEPILRRCLFSICWERFKTCWDCIEKVLHYFEMIQDMFETLVKPCWGGVKESWNCVETSLKCLRLISNRFETVWDMFETVLTYWMAGCQNVVLKCFSILNIRKMALRSPRPRNNCPVTVCACFCVSNLWNSMKTILMSATSVREIYEYTSIN